MRHDDFLPLFIADFQLPIADFANTEALSIGN
jgi:hypothetical protein